MFGNREEINTYLSQILDRQNDILMELRDINNNIVKYFGEKYDLKEKTLRQDIKNAHFTRNQFDVLKEVIKHTREKYSCIDKIDEVEIIKCGNCKWWVNNICTNVNGAHGDYISNPNWFCGSGLQKNEVSK